MVIPRIRTRSAQYHEPYELRGKWCFEISLWTFDGETQIGESMGPYGKFDSQEEAIRESKNAARIAAEVIEKSETGTASGKYIDMKNGGLLRSWEDN